MQADSLIDCSGFDHMRCERPGELVYTITKSELYAGEEVTYFAPFDRCDRVRDNERVWEVMDGERLTVNGERG